MDDEECHAERKRLRFIFDLACAERREYTANLVTGRGHMEWLASSERLHAAVDAEMERRG